MSASRPSKNLNKPDLDERNKILEEDGDEILDTAKDNYNSNKLVGRLNEQLDGIGDMQILEKLRGGFDETMGNIGQKRNQSGRKRHNAKYSSNHTGEHMDVIEYDAYFDDQQNSPEENVANNLPNNLFDQHEDKTLDLSNNHDMVEFICETTRQSIHFQNNQIMPSAPGRELDDSDISNLNKGGTFATNDSMIDPSPLKQPSWFDNLCEVSRIQAGVSRKKVPKDKDAMKNSSRDKVAKLKI